jgi:hypothetical protein
MADTPERPRPEAGADTRQGREGEGSSERKGESGGHRSPAGSTYGDYVPDRGQPRRSMDIDQEPNLRDYETGEDEADKEETIAEANRNKSFDTTHVHSSATVRKV